MNKIEFKQFLQNTKDNIQEKLNQKKIGTKISVSLKSKKTRKNLIIYAFLTLFCIAFLLLLSASTSPLYKDLCDGDSSIFIFFGKAITLGKDAYRDYFDHKGPILFYINALGYFLTKSKVGIFILQCISLSISSIFMYKTARFFHKTDTLGNLRYNHHSCIRCDNQRRQLNGRILYSLLYDSDLHRIKIHHKAPKSTSPSQKYGYLRNMFWNLCIYPRKQRTDYLRYCIRYDYDRLYKRAYQRNI